ncbi:MAG: Gfo/Idh/MocA family oxidoreductase [Actinobacteria bacterium]|nr:Gfo/Idh/MocA family oxidoreductase [Actinomycetota bacterium]
MKKIRFAFVGLRHPHIFNILGNVQQRQGTEIVAVCEEDPQTRQDVLAKGELKITHQSYEALLSEVDCDVITIGDYYSKRGQLILRALEAGKHVLSDKPICTSLAEFDSISKKVKDSGLTLGCQLDLRALRPFRTMHQLIKAGQIGDIQTISINAQHRLALGTRASWYFEPGCHGGTINDIGIHVVDMVEWLSGRQIVEIVAARAWNARAGEFPHFQDGAQFMLRLDNNGGVLADLSYLSPDACKGLPQTWRVTCSGSDGIIEATLQAEKVLLATKSDSQPNYIPRVEDTCEDYLDDFLNQIRGQTENVALSTQKVLRAAHLALLAQQAADTGTSHVPC